MAQADARDPRDPTRDDAQSDDRTGSDDRAASSPTPTTTDAASPGRSGVRQRLVTHLDGVRRGQVAVLTAPPGYGKRALVAAWLEANADLHPVRVTDLASRDAARASVAAALADAPSGDLAVVIVDDQDLAASSETMSPLVDLSSAPRVRLVVAARGRPDIALGALAARGRLIDMDGAELAYTREEVSTLLASHGYDATDEAIDQVMAASDGWPVVVDMMLDMHLPLQRSERLQRLMDSYIEDGIISFLGPEDRRLLSDLSMVRTLDPQVASMLADRSDAAAQLSRLQSIGVPIAWDSRNTIVINPAITSYFRRRVLLDEPGRAHEQLERAAAWLRYHDRSMEAVQLAMDAGLPNLGWMVVGDYVVTHWNEAHLEAALTRMFEVMPVGWETELISAVATKRASAETLLSHLHGIDAGNLLDLDYSGRSSYALFMLAMMRRAGYPHYARFDPLIELAAEVSEDEVTDMQRSQFGALQCEYGLWLLHQNRLEEAKTRLHDGVGIGRLTKSPWVVVTCLGALALINAAQGNRELALALVAETRMAYDDAVFDGARLGEYGLLADIILRLDTAESVRETSELEALRNDPGRLVELDAVVAGLQSMIHVANGESAAGLRVVSAYRDLARDETPMGALMVGSGAVLALSAQGDVARARTELERLSRLELPFGAPWRDVFAARLALADEQPEEARDLLRPYVLNEKAADARVTLSILGTYGSASAQLGDFAAAAETTERARTLAQSLGIDNHGSKYVPLRHAGRHEIDLTDAERKVLAHLDPNDTLGQTAEAMFISTNTLKTHLRRIYKKLGVSGREEAVERARALGITRAG